MPTILLIVAVVLAGCTGANPTATDTKTPTSGEAPSDTNVTRETVTGSTGAVGGSVKNSAPVVQIFTPDATTGENRGGFVVTFTGRVFDANTEKQIKNLSVTGVSGASILSVNHVITVDERNATAEPAAFGADGWKVWTATKNDGVLEYKFKRTFPAFTTAGVYDFRAYVFDAPSLFGVSTSVPITLAAFSDITISANPVDAAGNALVGQNWGQWDAEAGARNVTSANYIKLQNTGDTANAAVVIDFAASFDGSEDSSFVVPTANNLQFAWAEGAPNAAPQSLTFNYLATNADGTTTVTFSAKDNVIFVTYRVVQLPQVLPVQSYGIAFTVTEL